MEYKNAVPTCLRAIVPFLRITGTDSHSDFTEDLHGLAASPFVFGICTSLWMMKCAPDAMGLIWQTVIGQSDGHVIYD